MHEPDDDKTQTNIPLTKDTMVGHYRIVEKIGAGGMGEVYLARDTKLDRDVALKFLPHSLINVQDAQTRFTREARAAAGLKHANIVTIYEVSEYQGRPFFAMECCEGQPLSKIIQEQALSIDDILDLAIQICAGLKEAHDAGIIHRDIKPSNIILDKAGNPKLVDFGLATVKGSEELTKTGSTLGTIGYMSPEQIQAKTVDGRSDLFSVGVVLYELITGKSAFRRDNEAATLKAVLHDTPEPLARYKSNVSDDWQRIVSKLLEKDTQLRYQSAAGVISDLKLLKRDSGPVPIQPEKPFLRIKRLLVPVLMVVIAAVLFIIRPWEDGGRHPGEAVAAENRLAIMYFDNVADPTDSLRFGEIVTNLLITDLTESEYVQVVSSQRLYDILKQLGHEGAKKIDRSVATQIANKAMAKWMLVGNILNMEPEIIITAQLIDVGSGNTSASQRIEGEVGERLFGLVDRLTVEIKQDLALPSEAVQEADHEVAEMTTHSPEAYRYYLEGVELFRRHIWMEAEEVLLKAIEIDSTFAMAHARLAVINYWYNDPRAKDHSANAIKYADHASQRERLFIHSYDARINRDIPRAIENLEEIIKHYPDDKDAYVSLGLIKRFEIREFEEAITCFQKAVELDPFAREAINQLAYIYNDLGRFEEAIIAINNYIEIAPDEPNPYDSKGEILAMNGKLDEAIASHEKAIELKPDFGRSRLGDLYMFRGDYTRADSIYQVMVSDANENIRANGRLALTKIPRYQGRFEDALRLLEIGIATDSMELGMCPGIAEKLWKRAMVNDLFGDDRTVIDDLKRAISILEEQEARNTYSGVYKAYLAAKLKEKGDHVGADSLMDEISEAITEFGFPDSTDYWLASGFSAIKFREFNTAVTNYEKLVKQEPFQFPLVFCLGISYLGEGQLSDAVATLEKAINIYDNSRGSWPGRGVLCYYYLGMAYEASGWTDKAIEQYVRFLDIWKDADPGIEEIEDAKHRLNQLKLSS